MSLVAAARRVRLVTAYKGHAWLVPLSRPELLRAVETMLETLGSLPVQAPPAVELHLLDDAAISRANAQFMGCHGPTNILSFPGGADMPGSLLLSLDTLQRECLLYGQDPAEHVLRLLAHGMGHLCGLDHGPEMDGISGACLDAALQQVLGCESY